MFTKKLWPSIIIIVALTIGAAYFALYSPSDVEAATGVIDSPETREIKEVMQHAYRVMGKASQTFDVAEFSSVFVDTPDYQLSDEQHKAVTNILGKHIADDAGYLTAMQAQYISWGNGSKALQDALATAKAQNRNLTQEEFQAIVDANHGQMPPSPYSGNPVTDETIYPLEYQSIKIKGDRAIVRYDDGAAVQEAILVKINGKWLVAGIKPIWIHF